MIHPLLRCIARLTWLRNGIRSRLLRIFAAPQKQPHREFIQPFFGLRYRGWLDRYIDWCVYFYGAYEASEVAFMMQQLRLQPRRTCLDIGANVGHHSLLLSTLFAEVHAFEPYPPALAELRERLAMNALSERVIVHPVGLGAEDAELYFHPPQDINQGTGWFAPVKHPDASDAIRMNVCRGDLLVSHLAHIDFIKVDCECHEVPALEGLRETLARHRPTVILEWNFPDKPEMRERLLACLPPAYQIFTLETDRPFGPFNRPAGRLMPPRWDQCGTLWLVPSS